EQASLSQLKALLPRGSQWNLYACDLARGEQGKAFVDALAQSLNVQIFASTNKTGVINGADTALEYQAYPQSHDSDALISYLSFTDYPHTLTLADLENYAQSGGSGTPPSDMTYGTALINNIDPLNVDDYNLELVNQSATLNFTTQADIQALVNAINALVDYARDSTNPQPTLEDYATAGVEIDALNSAEINDLFLSGNLNDFTDIRNAIQAFYKLVDFAVDNSADEPGLDDYAKSGIHSVGNDIINYINSSLGREVRNGFTHLITPSQVFQNQSFSESGTFISDDEMTVAVMSNATTANTEKVFHIYRRDRDTWSEVFSTPLGHNYFTSSITHAHLTPDGRRFIIASDVSNLEVYDVELVAGEPDWSRWTKVSDITLPGVSQIDNLSVSNDGKTIVVSNPRHSLDFGRMWIFQQDVSGDWIPAYGQEISSERYYAKYIAISGNGQVVAVSREIDYQFIDILRKNADGSWRVASSIRRSTTSHYSPGPMELNEDGTRLAASNLSYNSLNTGVVDIFDDPNGIDAWMHMDTLPSPNMARNANHGKGLKMSSSGRYLVVSDNNGNDNRAWFYDLGDIGTSSSVTDVEYNVLFGRFSAYRGTLSMSANGRTIVLDSSLVSHPYTGVVTNINQNNTFDLDDASSTGIAFDPSLNDESVLSQKYSGALTIISTSPYALATTQYLQARVNGSNAILAWARGNGPAPSVDDYSDADIMGVKPSNLDDINIQLQTLALYDMADVQPMVDAINKILAYSASSAASPSNAPTDADYQLAGVPLFYSTAELNALILGQTYSIQDILALFPIPRPLLDVDNPLHVNDSIGFLNKQQVEDAFNRFVSTNSGATLSYVWQSKLPADTDPASTWADVSASQDITAYRDLAALASGLEYRLSLSLSRPGDLDFLANSQATSPVLLGGVNDINMVWDASNIPQVGVPYTVASLLAPNIDYKDKLLTWFYLTSGGTLIKLHEGEYYTPEPSSVDKPLVVNIAYSDNNGTILERRILTPDVIAAPTSTDLTDLAGVLNLALTPNGVSVGTLVSLTAADENEIANASAVTVTY
ncbi:MAG: DUF4347 domain-containing protein, partial [Vibrio campbellii]|nr:DUF4347 domain-containing protein [Vibrio campbellii]